ncbi:5'-nucleotidase [Marmoricola endophyticus]|uniref:5'-nucleotidase n=1 Tax=Marmoricola endophyticus TaxID=2040280 RepID=A0A917BSN5_9ACTN|nr:bifunctional metallophosphatase/5'-nucleotidase [Marmoricola endophyticus]GGF55333.1 5'-nucleotidase [Marmoricola endophyticus]
MHARRTRLTTAAALGASALLLAATGAPSLASGQEPAPGDPGRYEQLQMLSFNDFHGNLQAPSGSSGRTVVDHRIDPATGQPVDVTQDSGGVEYLATHLKQARKGHQGRTVTVAAGDIVGASPLLSAAFHDEPTVDAMNKLGLDVTSVGNHEFDEGYKEIQRLANGGCLPDGDGANNQNSCPDGKFRGADYDILAANVKYAGTQRTILPAYAVKKVGDARIGFIGMTLKGTPDIVTAAGVQGLRFTDEVTTANAVARKLVKKGVSSIVVLIHQGGVPTTQTYTDPATGKTSQVNPTYDAACGKGASLDPAASPILDISKRLDPSIDMVVSGHTHQPYVCDVPDPAGNPRMVTSASSFGRLFTDTELTYDRQTRDIVRTSVHATNQVVTRDVRKDPAQTSLIERFTALVRPIAAKVLGTISTDVNRTPNAAGETALGDLIADAQLADPSVVTGGKTPVVAFMNPGGVRADLTYANSPYGEAPGEVTYDEAFTVQPFNNYLVSLDLTGQQIYDLLAQQVTGANAGAPKVLQVSKGFAYRLGASGAVDGSVTLDGQPVDKGATYRVVTNNFLAGGGDGFPAFTQGQDVYFGGLDIDAFAAYLTSVSPYTPPALNRITR